jgi:hypothetical protein
MTCPFAGLELNAQDVYFLRLAKNRVYRVTYHLHNVEMVYVVYMIVCLNRPKKKGRRLEIKTVMRKDNGNVTPGACGPRETWQGTISP